MPFHDAGALSFKEDNGVHYVSPGFIPASALKPTETRNRPTRAGSIF